MIRSRLKLEIPPGLLVAVDGVQSGTGGDELRGLHDRPALSGERGDGRIGEVVQGVSAHAEVLPKCARTSSACSGVSSQRWFFKWSG
ncbi:Uncharacterised protein [Mycobacterium tuberculosis]|nr:Uncharacterised protein [Mycobacterium tuberculosis]